MYCLRPPGESAATWCSCLCSAAKCEGLVQSGAKVSLRCSAVRIGMHCTVACECSHVDDPRIMVRRKYSVAQRVCQVCESEGCAVQVQLCQSRECWCSSANMNILGQAQQVRNNAEQKCRRLCMLTLKNSHPESANEVARNAIQRANQAMSRETNPRHPHCSSPGQSQAISPNITTDLPPVNHTARLCVQLR